MNPLPKNRSWLQRRAGQKMIMQLQDSYLPRKAKQALELEKEIVSLTQSAFKGQAWHSD